MPISFTSFVYRTYVYWSVIHGIKRKPHLSVVWNWYHFVAIAILHQPRPTDSADINMRLQLSDTSSIPPMHGGFLLPTSHNGWVTNRPKASDDMMQPDMLVKEYGLHFTFEKLIYEPIPPCRELRDDGLPSPLSVCLSRTITNYQNEI